MNFKYFMNSTKLLARFSFFPKIQSFRISKFKGTLMQI